MTGGRGSKGVTAATAVADVCRLCLGSHLPRDGSARSLCRHGASVRAARRHTHRLGPTRTDSDAASSCVARAGPASVMRPGPSIHGPGYFTPPGRPGVCGHATGRVGACVRCRKARKACTVHVRRCTCVAQGAGMARMADPVQTMAWPGAAAPGAWGCRAVLCCRRVRCAPCRHKLCGVAQSRARGAGRGMGGWGMGAELHERDPH